MSISMTLFSPSPTAISPNTHFTHRPTLFLSAKRPHYLLLYTLESLPENGAGVSVSAAAVEDPKPQTKVPELTDAADASALPNGAPNASNVKAVSTFEDPKWVGGTWDLQQFKKEGKIDWDAVIDAGGAAMIGLFMAYLVDQMSNFFCKTLLFVAVAGVLLIRKNEDIENIEKLIKETTFYDEQWQATSQDDTSGSSKND